MMIFVRMEQYYKILFFLECNNIYIFCLLFVFGGVVHWFKLLFVCLVQ